jgi:hypothetical protein
LANYDDNPGTYHFYCDREWNCLNDTYHEDLAAAEAQALFEFPGVVFVDACWSSRPGVTSRPF